MNDRWRNEYRARGLQLVTLLVLVSFAFIPVRCDASAAPHSIFVDPVAIDTEHEADPSGSQMSGMAGMHHHHAGMTQSDAAADGTESSPLQDVCAVHLANGADPESQQPVGATLDLPTTTALTASTILPPLDGESIARPASAVDKLTGIAAPPDAPPPKSI